jgi:branched-chain amino acid transport system substrate-binding protein
VKIAHAGPLTGSIAHLGKDDENGVALAVAQAERQKITIDGKPVTFTMQSEDDQADPKVGTTVAQKLVDAKVAAVIGHLNSGVSIPASEIYSKAGIPMISGSATNPTLTERGMKTVFRTVGRDDQQGPAIASYVAKELKGKKSRSSTTRPRTAKGIANEVEKTLKGRQGLDRRARAHHRQGNRLQGDPHQDQGEESRRRLPRRHGRDRRPDAQAGARARHQGHVRVRRRRVHRRDGQARGRRGRRHGAARRRACRAKPQPRSSSRPFTAKYGEIKQYAPYFYDATWPSPKP